MANFNKVILMGNLTRDPQLSYTPSQTAVVDFGIATNRRWTGQDGQQREETCFVDCRAFGKTAENINKYCKKGRLLMVEGRLVFDSWTGKDGAKRSKLRVTVENFQFLPVGGSGGEQSSAAGDEFHAPSEDVSSANEAQSSSKDDIPF
jgi:single-strand DNA-binding protein